VLRFLNELADDERNNVVIISGRDSYTLDKWLGSLRVILVAEHGAKIKYPGQEWQQLVELRMGWEKDILPVMEIFTKRCNGSFIEEKQFSIAWHYRNVPRQLGFSRSRELIQHLSNILANTILQVIDGNKVVEVRVASTSKGQVARKIYNELQPDFTLVLGDDKTDEDMFKELQNDATTIKIGLGNTAASYTIPKQKDVDYLLNSLLPLEYK
jgi:trehalose 6-phosphate synthase/phosphatase